MKVLLLSFVILFSAYSFAFDDVYISQPVVQCSIWDIDIESGDATCLLISLKTEISNGIHKQMLNGQILSSENVSDDLTMANGFCAKSGYESARSVSTDSRGNAFYDGFFLLDENMEIVKLIKRESIDQIIGPVIEKITCIPKTEQ